MQLDLAYCVTVKCGLLTTLTDFCQPIFMGRANWYSHEFKAFKTLWRLHRHKMKLYSYKANVLNISTMFSGVSLQIDGQMFLRN